MWRRKLLIAAALVAGSLSVQAQPTTDCLNAPPTRLILRERARVAPDDPRPLNMRSNPGTDFPIVAVIPANWVVYVVEGPRCTENYAWLCAEYDGTSGWIAEGDTTAYYIEVYPPGW